MTNPTTNPDLIAAIKKLDKHVMFPGHVDLVHQLIKGDGVWFDGQLKGKDTWVYCPPACEAAVVMWAEELRGWITDQGLGATVMLSTYHEDIDIYRSTFGKWKWTFSSSKFEVHKEGGEETRTEAAIALIIAIAANLEE